MRRILLFTIAPIALIATSCAVRHRPEAISSPRSPEEIVYARSNDDVLGAGVLFTPRPDSIKRIAIIWIHGWGVNFYQPSYIAIGRGLAQHGYTTISGNTRMHDLGNVEGYRGDKRIRGGGYWGVGSDEPRDLAAWIDLAERHGFKNVVLVGHSAGWAAVRSYMANVQDPRVIGIVLASGEVDPDTRRPDPDQFRQAQELMAKGEGDALFRDPKRSFPSYISAATFLDIWPTNAPRAVDFFGIRTTNAPISRVHAPLLAFFGASDDVGGQRELDLLKAAVARQKEAPRVTTALITGADHMYTGQEQQVSDVIATWAAGLFR
jgi:pimeloyl-ACP methyl ester carboxylesterase